MLDLITMMVISLENIDCLDSWRVLSQFQRVVQLVSQKAWRVADLFGAVVQFCQLQEREEEEGKSLSSLFDWLLQTA